MKVSYQFISGCNIQSQNTQARVWVCSHEIKGRRRWDEAGLLICGLASGLVEQVASERRGDQLSWHILHAIDDLGNEDIFDALD